MSSVITQLRNRWFSLKGAKRPIPAGFMKLDYLESTGTQWIRTLISSAGIRWKLKTQGTSSSSSSQIVAGANANTAAWIGGTSSGHWQNTESQISYADVAICDLSFSRAGGTWSQTGFINDVAVNATGSGTASIRWRFFGASSSSVSSAQYYAQARLWYAVGIVDSTTVCDYIPLLALPGTTYTDGNTGNSVTATDFKPGMYDYVSGRFFVNQGTGADFLYSPLPPSA